MSGTIDDERYLQLTGPFRALYRAARRAENAPSAADDKTGAEERDPADPIHSAMRRQVEDLLRDAEVSAEQRRRILDSIACPCCGGSGASFAMSIKPASKAGF